MTEWYYVKDRQRVGPVTEDHIKGLVEQGGLDEEGLVWKKGLQNWQKIGQTEDLSYLLAPPPPELGGPSDETQEFSVSIEDIAPIKGPAPFRWEDVDPKDRRFYLKIGFDRGESFDREYGPYCLEEIQRAYGQGRINEKTYIHTKGLDNWIFLGDIPRFESLFSPAPPPLSQEDRRRSVRRPFTARLLFHNGREVFDGLCRDVSVGGLQILVAGAPCQVGDLVKINVHPDNSETSFTAQGTVVRTLDGGRGFAMRFEQLSSEAHRAIESYVSQS